MSRIRNVLGTMLWLQIKKDIFLRHLEKIYKIQLWWLTCYSASVVSFAVHAHLSVGWWENSFTKSNRVWLKCKFNAGIKRKWCLCVGDAGSQGPQGAIGPPGNTGATGFQGATGSTGFGGFQGEQGVQGLSGPEGPSGQSGQLGAGGSNGFTGFTGQSGMKIRCWW